MSSAPSRPSSNNNGAGDPSQQISAAREIVNRNLRQHLEPADFVVMGRANQQLMNHATLGLLLGAGMGVAWGMKGRRIGSFRMAGGGGGGGAFYPTAVRGAGQKVIGAGEDAAKDEGAELTRKTRTFFRSVVWGFLGSLAGCVSSLSLSVFVSLG